jgi:3-deoxy-7-phosphoheptulonate synthase
MLVIMEKEATQEQIDEVMQRIRSFEYECHPMQGKEGLLIGATGDGKGRHRIQVLECLPGVERVVPISSPYKLASRETKKDKTLLKVNEIEIGNGKLVVIAGPCSVESEEQLMESARVVREAGASILRGGAFKPRSSPYSFQGLAEEGLKLLAAARSRFGLAVVTEVINPRDVDLVASYADILQIGARNAQNFSLLKEVGQARKPILLKRGMMTSIEEYLMSAEYILSEGNGDVILCERGIRTFETATRNTLDISAVPVLKKKTHLDDRSPPLAGKGPFRRESIVKAGSISEAHGRSATAGQVGREGYLTLRDRSLAGVKGFPKSPGAQRLGLFPSGAQPQDGVNPGHCKFFRKGVSGNGADPAGNSNPLV